MHLLRTQLNENQEFHFSNQLFSATYDLNGFREGKYLELILFKFHNSFLFKNMHADIFVFMQIFNCLTLYILRGIGILSRTIFRE